MIEKAANFLALPNSLKMIQFPSWPGFVPAIRDFLAKLLRRGCPAQGRA
jgi:hypothetical protein